MTSIADRLAQVCHRIAVATESAGLPAATVRLLAVSKTFGPEAVLEAVAAGQRDFGENYVQEGVAKRLAAAQRISHADAEMSSMQLRWHFIGPLQSNKTRDVAENFDWVHTIDRVKIAQRLSDQRPAALAPLQVCLQVNIDNEPTKSGVLPTDVVAESLAIGQLAQQSGRLRLRGLMAIPAPSQSTLSQRTAFAQLRQLLDTVNAAIKSQAPSSLPLLDTLSMGMSADLESAIAESAPHLTTWVRIGSAIFGDRTKAPSHAD